MNISERTNFPMELSTDTEESLYECTVFSNVDLVLHRSVGQFFVVPSTSPFPGTRARGTPVQL